MRVGKRVCIVIHLLIPVRQTRKNTKLEVDPHPRQDDNPLCKPEYLTPSQANRTRQGIVQAAAKTFRFEIY
jgi:hypothetical protein